MENNDLFEILLKLYIVAVSMLGIYWIILKLLGHSPTADQIGLVMITGIFSGVIWLVHKIGKIDATLKFQGKILRDYSETSKYHSKKLDTIGNDLKEHLQSH